MFLFIRMMIYVLAVPFAAYLGGTFDTETGMLCIDLDATISIVGGLAAAGITFASSRIAKKRGGVT